MTYEPGPRRALVLELHKQGRTPREIAALLNLSTERVHQHLRALEQRGLLKRERSA